jgi:hypothetical protein
MSKKVKKSQASYFVNCAVVRGWIQVDDEGTLGLPVLLPIFSSNGELIDIIQATEDYPLRASDARKIASLVKKSSIIYCPADIAPTIRQAIGSSYTVLVKELAEQHPNVARDLHRIVKGETDTLRRDESLCFFCQGSNRCDYELSRKCFCQPMLSVPGVLESRMSA